jgi:hypothetical protein
MFGRLKWWSLEVTSSMLKEKSRVNAWLAAIAPGTEIQAEAPFTVVSSMP